MNAEPRLSEAQWNLLVQLLEQEENELPTEIHHTRTASVKADLQQRLELVRQTLGQIRGVAAV